MRIAMWSGPRNLSTAMMYAFGQRPDCAVIDEPFYAAYLSHSGEIHPMQEAVLAAQPQDPMDVIAQLLGPVPEQREHFYQKHMTHHMVSSIPREWMREVTNVFLIRHPARVIASYTEKNNHPTLEDVGFPQQLSLFEDACALGQTPVVIDASDIRNNPERMLHLLCDALQVPFIDAMLTWPAGGHRSDGVWAPHWYDAVHRSTGFAGPEKDLPELNAAQQELCEEALPIYDSLAVHKLR